MVESLSTESAQASGDNGDHAAQVTANFDGEMSAVGPRHPHPCSQRVGGSPSFDIAQCSKQQVHSFESMHDSSEMSEPAPESSFDAPPSNHSAAASSVSFSEVQMSCPTVIEIFCGSARVTASLKELGLSECFGVDHDIKKAVSTAKRLDLTLKSDQELLLHWLKSPLIVGIFIAPPCGTCSMARYIKLRDASGKPLPGPIPLRSQQFPEGIPGLEGRNRARVSAANRLYDFVSTVILQALTLKIIIVVENPRSSLFWLTRFWKVVAKHFTYTAHQACSYGGDRPKWTVLASNHKAFHSINLSCPGVSASHVHKPWGLVHTQQGTHFSTSEETAYPRDLARVIARSFAIILQEHGWKPPDVFFQPTADATLQVMRAVATSQPKAARMPPVVREHKQIVVVRGPVQLLNSIPVETMQRSKQPVFLPHGCFSKLNPLPAGSQLLRSVPLRLNGEWSDKSNEIANQESQPDCSQSGSSQSGSTLAEQAWGIPFTPEEFVQEAQLRGHPKLFTQLMPGILAEAVQVNFCESQASLVKARASWFAKWTNRAKVLATEEAELKANMPDHMSKILQPKRLVLWKEILTDLGYSDIGVIDELANGTELVGEVPPCGVFEKSFKAAEITVEGLARSSRSSRFQQFYKCRSSGDGEVDELVFAKTQEEVRLGWARGPYTLEELPEGATISRRFGLRQPGKIRLIDDLSASNVNQTVQCSESPKPHSVDFVAALKLNMLRQGVGTSIKGRSFDLKSAYKQLAISARSLIFAFVAVYNPGTKKPEIYQLLAAPFGATRSVYSFLRASPRVVVHRGQRTETDVELFL